MSSVRAVAMSLSLAFCALLASLAVALAVPAGDNKPVPTLPGTCPDFKPVATLDSSKFVGDWYLTHSLKKGIEQQEVATIKCVKQSISITPDGSVQSVVTFTRNDKQMSKTSSGSPIDGKYTKLSVKNESGDDKKPPRILTIVAAEPDTYYASVLCGSEGTNHGYLVKVLSKEKTISAANLAKVKDALTGANITGDLKAAEGC